MQDIESYFARLQHGASGTPEEEMVFFKSIVQQLSFTQNMLRANIEDCNNKLSLRTNRVQDTLRYLRDLDQNYKIDSRPRDNQMDKVTKD